VGSTIIGATNLIQIQENIDAAQITLSKELLDGIEAIHTEMTNPGQ
jgi:aryl-alcohol dehydrogenase-like predicted oxidoreductase